MGDAPDRLDSVCVFCGSSDAAAPALLASAADFGAILAREGLTMIYGGGAKAAYFLTRLAARSVQFAITGILDVLVVWLLQRSGALRAVGLPPVQSKGNDIQ